LATDLDYILQHTKPVWEELQGKAIFITGGTGFIGTWLSEIFYWANEKLSLDLSVMVLTRDSNAFAKKVPHLASDSFISFLHGDVRDFIFPDNKPSYIIHAAAAANAKLNQECPRLMLDTIFLGAHRVLDFASYTQAKKMLFLSSGAVYGKQPPDMSYIEESYHGTLNALDPYSAYAVGKLVAEHMCGIHAQQHQTEIKIARCFAFVGPYLPLDRHFAIGNFIRDALSGNSIHVSSDGSAYRSYQYVSDLIVWLLHILCFGESLVPYNVGSSEAISIVELARSIAKYIDPAPEVKLANLPKKNSLPERYVPSVKRAKEYFGFSDGISLPDALHKTIHWYRHT
jgi:dTDP-glucose 4,6-dehydratase